MFFLLGGQPSETYTLSLHDALPSFGQEPEFARAALELAPERPVPREREAGPRTADRDLRDRKSTRLNSSHVRISYGVFCLKKKDRAELDCSTTMLTELFPVFVSIDP